MTEVKKELTKDLLALSFKDLIMKMPFEKITVKMITDGADVIRPTIISFLVFVFFATFNPYKFLALL